MAKTYVDAVKYLIRIQFQIKGIVDKPDIVGAVFGQSEGLLGEEMDLRELQKKGRVGRIEVNVHQEGGHTAGEIHVPTSMDMAETSVLAAAIETVDKVGPCESRFVTQGIDDVRQSKRADIAKRAKELLARLKMEQSPEIDTLTEEIRSDVRAGALVEYGRDRLAAGPEVDSAEEVIVVEGRADVVNMLKHGIKNVISMGGSRISQDVINLSRRKTLVLFADGDRGGELNARKLHQIANVQFVCVAPDGKEVEELQQKEIIQSLRRRLPISQFLDSIGVSVRESGRGMSTRDARGPRDSREGRDSRDTRGQHSMRGYDQQSPMREMGGMIEPSGMDSRIPRGREVDARSRRRDMGEMFPGFGPAPGLRSPETDLSSRRDSRPAFSPRGSGRGRIHPQFGMRMEESEVPQRSDFSTEGLPSFESATIEVGAPAEKAASVSTSEYAPLVAEVKGKKLAKFLDASRKEIASVPVRDVVAKLKSAKNVHTIVFDGIITDRLVEAADKAGAQLIVGVKKGKLSNTNVKTIVVQ